MMYATGCNDANSMWSCARDVVARDGVAGFMKGWSASYARLGPHTVIMFLTAEKLRSWAGLTSL